MRISRSLDWMGVRDKRNGDWKRMKGDFGELVVREALERRGLILERMGRQARGLPDFKVKGRPVMVEVKTHRARLPGIWQKKGFLSMVRMGWRILIARPRIFLDRTGESFSCTGIDWFEFTWEGKLRGEDKFFI